MMQKIAIILFMFVFGMSTIAQTYSNDNSSTAVLRTLQESIAHNNQTLQSNGFDNSNLVVIDQLGEKNSAVINSTSNESDITLIQQGNDNAIFLNIQADIINEKVVQSGNNHNFTDFSNNVQIHNLELVQSGNNQNLVWYGGNSISDNLKVTMQGESQSVIIRNFN